LYCCCSLLWTVVVVVVNVVNLLKGGMVGFGTVEGRGVGNIGRCLKAIRGFHFYGWCQRLCWEK